MTQKLQPLLLEVLRGRSVCTSQTVAHSNSEPFAVLLRAQPRGVSLDSLDYCGTLQVPLSFASDQLAFSSRTFPFETRSKAPRVFELVRQQEFPPLPVIPAPVLRSLAPLLASLSSGRGCRSSSEWHHTHDMRDRGLTPPPIQTLRTLFSRWSSRTLQHHAVSLATSIVHSVGQDKRCALNPTLTLGTAFKNLWPPTPTHFPQTIFLKHNLTTSSHQSQMTSAQEAGTDAVTSSSDTTGCTVNGTDKSNTRVRETTFKIYSAPGDGEDGDFPSAFRPRPELSLVVLNFDLPPFTHLLWEQAGGLRLCADGGANRLFDSIPQFFPSEDPDSVRNRFIPHVIKGDLDSIRPEVMKFYQDRGSQVYNMSEDQDTTDLHKCIAHVLAHCGPTHPGQGLGKQALSDTSNGNCSTPESAGHREVEIVVVGGLGGRVDHEMGNINVLHRFQGVRITLLSAYCTLTLLPGKQRHRIIPDPVFEGPHCGLVPVQSPSKCTSTTGLRWNLNKLAMEFGGLVSTSNQIVERSVIVESDVPLLWSTEIRLQET